MPTNALQPAPTAHYRHGRPKSPHPRPAPRPKPRSRISDQITKRADGVMDHVGIRVTDMREEQQRATSEWIQGELDRTTDWMNNLRVEQQQEAQKEASRWLESEMEKMPKVVMTSARDTFLGWLTGEEGLGTAVLAWVPVALVAGETLKVGLDVAKVVYGLLAEDGSSRRRAIS
ncbi:hypothetical protein OQA88_2424 [Cercophora sp. LCS_1]